VVARRDFILSPGAVSRSGKMKFKVLNGKHSQDGKVYEAGSVIPSKRDLTKVFKNKFEKVASSTPSSKGREVLQQTSDEEETPQEPDEEAGGDWNAELDSMTIPELRKFALEEDIDLGTATKKEEIVNTIRSALDVA
jgi:hypothetical protein